MFDVMVGCGLCALPLALLSHWAGARADSMAGIVVAALAVLVNGPHYAATAVRADSRRSGVLPWLRMDLKYTAPLVVPARLGVA